MTRVLNAQGKTKIAPQAGNMCKLLYIFSRGYIKDCRADSTGSASHRVSHRDERARVGARKMKKAGMVPKVLVLRRYCSTYLTY